ncbi:GNAT family N-acetyltransferase [Rhodopseudomonas palustris]|uniref:GCN5-related N-acetyltransferase n=1 Tax=Rhodopseudomonas palustris (strain BisB18) TaxID=316056 RepID=Q20Z01_RHOPB
MHAASPITIRPARRDDVAAIVAMLADDHLGRGREVVADPLPESYYAAFDALQGAPHIQMVVATDGSDAVVGCLQLAVLPGLSSQGASRGIIEDVRVAGDHRSQGIGEQMVRWAISEAQVQGCKLVELFTHQSRVDAQRFYARLGFQPSHVGMTLRF